MTYALKMMNSVLKLTAGGDVDRVLLHHVELLLAEELLPRQLSPEFSTTFQSKIEEGQSFP